MSNVGWNNVKVLIAGKEIAELEAITFDTSTGHITFHKKKTKKTVRRLKTLADIIVNRSALN